MLIVHGLVHNDDDGVGEADDDGDDDDNDFDVVCFSLESCCFGSVYIQCTICFIT